MNRTITLEYDYAQPVEAVWQALTDPQAIARWLMPNDFLPQVGHRFQFHTRPIPRFGFDGTVNCEVLEVVAPTRLAYSWQGGALNSRVLWTLTPTERGTHLRLEHSGFEGLQNLPASLIMGQGWKKMLRGTKLAAEIQAIASQLSLSSKPGLK